MLSVNYARVVKRRMESFWSLNVGAKRTLFITFNCLFYVYARTYHVTCCNCNWMQLSVIKSERSSRSSSNSLCHIMCNKKSPREISGSATVGRPSDVVKKERKGNFVICSCELVLMMLGCDDGRGKTFDSVND